MQGRAFLNAARRAAAGTTEEDWRAGVIHAYYGLFLECRDALVRWGFSIPRQQSVHSYVRFRFLHATDADLKRIGNSLDPLFRDRSKASYDLIATAGFTSDALANQSIQKAENALALLDQIDADPARRAAAIAAIPP
jgi:hypothetical protein